MEWIRINKKDNVAVAITDIEKNQLIKKGHKFALRDIAKGEKVIKYGAPIGIATKDMADILMRRFVKKLWKGKRKAGAHFSDTEEKMVVVG